MDWSFVDEIRKYLEPFHVMATIFSQKAVINYHMVWVTFVEECVWNYSLRPVRYGRMQRSNSIKNVDCQQCLCWRMLGQTFSMGKSDRSSAFATIPQRFAAVLRFQNHRIVGTTLWNISKQNKLMRFLLNTLIKQCLFLVARWERFCVKAYSTLRKVKVWFIYSRRVIRVLLILSWNPF